MTRILSANSDGLGVAAEILRRGGLVAFPTDTVYGVGCRAGDPAALDWLFVLKGRPPDRRVAWLLADRAAADELGLEVDARAERLAGRFWPGPLTLVLRRRTPQPGDATLGVRVPDHPVTHRLLSTTGPLATSSANRTGEPEARTVSEVLAAFGDVPGGTGLDAVVDGGEAPGGVSSSVVDLSVTPARLLREGALSRKQIEGVIGPLD